MERFCFADPLLPFGAVRKANAHCTHLQIAHAIPQPKFAKECNYPPYKYNPAKQKFEV